MAADTRVAYALLEGRHGVSVERNGVPFSREMVRTRRGARRLYADFLARVETQPGRADAVPGDELVISRIERRRVVETGRVRIPGDPPAGACAREPRRRSPSQGGASAVAAPEDDA